jgi:AraC-like DNA-binding protein
MTYTFYNIVEILTSFQGVLFAFYLFFAPKKRKVSNALIGLFLLLLSINISFNFIEPYTNEIGANLSVFIMMTAYLMAPSIYLYIKSSIDPTLQLTWKDSIHLLPFIAFNLLIIPSVYLVNLQGGEAPVDGEGMVNLILYVGFYAQIFFYLFLSFRLLYRSKKLYFENYSNTDIRKFNYLFQFSILVSLIFIVSAIKNIIVFSMYGEFIDASISIVLLLILVFLCWMIYKGLNSPELFNNSKVKLVSINTIIKEEQRRINISQESTENNSLKLENGDEMTKQLYTYMDVHKPYLDPSLSLDDLASKLQLSTRELSILINHHLNKHFFDFINEYRINEAAELLKSPSDKKRTVLEILYEVGFNSKSSFNTAFKKKTGFTPTEYRKEYAPVSS